MKTFALIEDLRIGNITEVSGAALQVELSSGVTELTRTYDGRVYPLGQVGSIVKIHFGRRVLFGSVTLLRMRSEEEIEKGSIISPDADQRVMHVQLFAEGVWDSAKKRLEFYRGLTTYPLPRQGVFLLTSTEAKILYQAAEDERDDGYNPLIPFAHYVGADSVICRANTDRMFGLHCAVLGSTGSGKSGAVAALLHAMLEHKPVAEHVGCHPRVILIDPHGEYASSFNERAQVYRLYNTMEHESVIGDPIILPYWLMSGEEFRSLVIGKTEYEATAQNNVVHRALIHARLVVAGLVERAPSSFTDEPPVGVRAAIEDGDHILKDEISSEQRGRIEAFDSDKPYPFCLKEFANHVRYIQAGRIQNNKYQSVTSSDFGKGPEKSVLEKLAVLRNDPRLKFMMPERPAESFPLESVIAQLVGVIGGDAAQKKDIRILDVSGLPNEIAGPLTAAVARLLFQYKLYQTETERARDPVVLVCEEAHRYVPNQGEAEYAVAQKAIRRIAREGRKYGLGLMLVSQRPADIESTVISQCGTWLVLRLTNDADQQHVAKFLPDNLSGMVRALPTLAQQEALFVGQGAALPARVKIADLPEEKLPHSAGVKFAKSWVQLRLTEEELKIVAARMAPPIIR